MHRRDLLKLVAATAAMPSLTLADERKGNIVLVSPTIEKIVVVASTLEKGDYPCTKDNLVSLAKTANGVPITLNFKEDEVIGKVQYAWVQLDRLFCKVDIDPVYTNKQLYLVPGYIIPDYRLITLGLTDKPLDRENILPI